MMIDNTRLKKLSTKEFEKYYKNHCDLDSKMNQLLFFLIPLYKQYNEIYQNNLEPLKEANEDQIYITRLNNIHQEIKNQQERIYVNRLKMTDALKNNVNLDSEVKKQYSNNLIKIYQTNLVNNQNYEDNLKNFNNECIEPYFDTHQRLFFNIKCNQFNNISELTNLQSSQISNEISCQQNNKTNQTNSKNNGLCGIHVLPINQNNRMDRANNCEVVLHGNNQNGILQPNNNSISCSRIDIHNNTDDKIPNKPYRNNGLKKNNFPNVNVLQLNRSGPSIVKHSKKNIKVRSPNKMTKTVVKNYKPNMLVNNTNNINHPPNRPNVDKQNNTNLPNNNSNGVDIKQLDKAYIKKHNELMNVYKAYQILFNKVNKYKDDLDKVKSLSTSKIINNDTMNKMLQDQKYVMNSVDKMQEALVKKNILTPEERIPTEPVVSHPQNMEHFNNTLKDQINEVIEKKSNINGNIKKKLFNLLNTSNKFINNKDSNINVLDK